MLLLFQEWKDGIICLPCLSILNEFDNFYEIVKKNCKTNVIFVQKHNQNDFVEQNDRDLRSETIEIAQNNAIITVAKLKETDQNKISIEVDNEQKEPVKNNEQNKFLNNNKTKDNISDNSIKDKKTGNLLRTIFFKYLFI